MFGLGMGEVVIILVLALLLLGPQRLPDAAKQIGKGLREFRKATEDLKQQFESELYLEDKPGAKPTLVPPVGPPASDAALGIVPPGGVPVAAATAGEVPKASADNVPGLEAALAEPVRPPTFSPEPEAAPEPSPAKAS
ncbi:MAG: twin-arginine translocase TatA/TatE family subunit [Anaeromyxobacteraceae bacterium]